jgi:hypothetical protein
MRAAYPNVPPAELVDLFAQVPPSGVNPTIRAANSRVGQHRLRYPGSRRRFDRGIITEENLSVNDDIYVNANEGPAILRYPSGRLVRCETLSEAAAEFDRLPAHHQDMTTMRVGSKVYKADEIRRFHHGPKPQ